MVWDCRQNSLYGENIGSTEELKVAQCWQKKENEYLKIIRKTSVQVRRFPKETLSVLFIRGVNYPVTSSFWQVECFKNAWKFENASK